MASHDTHGKMSIPLHQTLLLSSELWDVCLSRLKTPPTIYMRRMGMIDQRRPLPACTLDQFFTVESVSAKTYVSVGSSDPADTREWSPASSTHCKRCGSEDVTPQRDGDTCMACGESVACLRTVNTEPVCTYGTNGGRRATADVYKRMNHFVDHLRRVQGKESASIRSDVIHAVRREIAKERIYDGDPRITTAKVRAVLKKLKLQKHYVHVFLIASRLSGRSAPALTPAQEEKLLGMFSDIQEPFERHCPPHRTNMLSYTYVLRKFCEILGWNELSGYFPLLKSRTKVKEQDRIWRAICEELGYRFDRSIA